jgi:protein-tyrosine kinase
MSKIYKALEKAERERERELKKDLSLVSEIEGEAKKESQMMSDHPKVARMVSDQGLVSFFQPGSLASEQFRKLRTHLFRSRNSGPPKTIMVTSATSSEGKTFVSANLAIGIAHDLHAHALLVDCDLRNPSVAKCFSLENGKGLSDYLVGNEQISELLRKAEVEKLSILTSGAMQDNPTELMGSKKMESLVQELKSRYSDRYIIFDSTPLLATTEPEVLGKLVDGIIIVVRAGVTLRETVKRAIAPLDKEKVLGFVLNSLEFKSPGLSHRYFGSYGYYYSKYGYSRGYGYSKGTSNHQGRWKKIFRKS